MTTIDWNWKKNNNMPVPARGNCFNKFFPSRYQFAIFGTIAMVIVCGIKLDLSIPMGAKDAVLNARSRKGGLFKLIGESIPVVNNESCRTYFARKVQNGTFQWSEPLQGTLLSSYLWGYLISQIPAAFIAERVTARYVMVFSIVIHIVCLVAMPLTNKLHCSIMTFIRIGEGIGAGVVFPAMHVMLADWSPPYERSTMASVVYAGTSLGIAFSIFQTGYTTILGTVAFAWLLGWIFLIRDTPNKQPMIMLSERNYINSSLDNSDRSDDVEVQMSVPWREIFTSLPFLAILVAHTCFFWGWYTILIGTSLYFEELLDFNIKDNAVSSVPFVTMWLFSLMLSKVLDSLCARQTISITLARKMATLIATVVPTICLFLLCFIGYNRSLAGLLMGIAITSNGGIFSGFFVNHIDIAPNYAGTLMAITNTIATIPALIIPIFIDSVTHGNQTISGWRIIFFVAIAFYMIGIIIYTLFGSGEEEPWNKLNAIELNTISTYRDKSELAPFKDRQSRMTYDNDN